MSPDPNPDLPETQEETIEKFQATAHSLTVLLEEMKFRERGNNVLRSALAFVLIFGSSVVVSSSVSYCLTAKSAPGWCAIVPGTALDARTSVDVRISNLEQRVSVLEKAKK